MQSNLSSVLTYSRNEKDAIKKYRLENHDLVNALLERSIDREIYLEENNLFFNITSEDLEKLVRQIINMYSIMYKNMKKNYIKPTEKFYRADTNDVFLEIKNTNRINRFLGAILNEEVIGEYFEQNDYDKKVVLHITKEEDVPYIYMRDVMDEIKYSNEILLSPFTQVKNISEFGRFKDITYYNLKLENQKILMVTELETHALQKHIFGSVEEVVTNFRKYLQLEKEIKKQIMQRDTLTFRLSDRTLEKEDREKIEDEYEKISNTLTSDLEILNSYKDNYIEWKDNTIYYIKYMCEKIKESIDLEYQRELEKAKDVVKEEEINGYKEMLILSRQNTLDKIIKNKKGIMQIFSNLNRIEVKQEKFKDLSIKIRINYIPYCNVEKDIKEVNLLLDKIDKLKFEVQNIEINVKDGLEFDKQNQKLIDILQINMDIEKWIKEVLDKEMLNINKGELLCFKRGISHRIEEDKALANIKIIKEENDRINSKSNLKKILDKITGQAKQDELILVQNKIKEDAIREKLKNIKYENKEIYSTHEMVADLDIYIDENKDKEVIAKDIHRLKILRNNIGEIFKLQEASIERIIENRLKNNLPIEINKKKVSKQEKIKLDTENFLAKNGYIENEDVVLDELLGQSQAMLANETKRLLSYIEEKNKNI